MTRPRRAPQGVNVLVKGKNVAVPADLRDHVVRKMQKLDKYLDRLTQIEVELSKEQTRDITHQNHVEATAHVPGRTIRVATQDMEMFAAVDEAVDKLYRQLNRHKERLKTHQAVKLADSPLLAVEAPEPAAFDSEEEPPEPQLRIERLEVKPQFEDEALEALEALERDFYVFLNARNEQINVLYRRSDGDYGLIEPRFG